MARDLSGKRVAILATDGVERVEDAANTASAATMAVATPPAQRPAFT